MRAPPVPPPVPELIVLDFDSDALRKQLADERDAALRATSESGPVVQRKFYVGWEMHYGYYLMPVDDPGMHIAPDFGRSYRGAI